MLTSISPLGERARGNRWATTAAVYVVASLLGGLTTGALLGAAGSRLRVPALVAVLVCLVAAGLDVAGRRPTLHRQVDEDWLSRYRGWVYGAGYGFQLGLGVVTIVTSAATYAMVGLCLLAGGVAGAAAVGATFGLVRALPLLTLHAADTPERLRAVAGRLERLSRLASRGTVGALALGAGLLAASA
ncbi:MAG: hypothetical protein NVSMB55_06890 [Mycobacteriales bacterium]